MEEKLKNHLWYFTSENIVLALFDDKVAVEEKRRIIKNMMIKEIVDANRPLKFTGNGEDNNYSLEKIRLLQFLTHYPTTDALFLFLFYSFKAKSY